MIKRFLRKNFPFFPFLVFLAFTLIAGCEKSTTTTPSDSEKNNFNEDALRVFVYNIQHGRGMDDVVDIERIADVIRQKDPHLVALNEVDVNIERSGNVDIMEILAESLEMERVFGKNLDHEGGEYGNGILTNLPILTSENLHLEMAEEGEQRGLLQAEVDFNGVRIAFMTTHLDHRSDVNRQVAVEQIFEVKENYAGMPILVTGDFNARPEDGVIGQMGVHFNDVWDEVGEGPGYTIPVPESVANRRIDYVFYSNSLVEERKPTLRPIHMKVINSTASDHLPVYAEFEVIDN